MSSEKWEYINRELLADGSEQCTVKLDLLQLEQSNMTEAVLEGIFCQSVLIRTIKMTIYYADGAVRIKEGNFFYDTDSDMPQDGIVYGRHIWQCANGTTFTFEGAFRKDFFEGEIQQQNCDIKTVYKGQFPMKSREVDLNALVPNVERHTYCIANGEEILVDKYSGELRNLEASGEGEWLVFCSNLQNQRLSRRYKGRFTDGGFLYGTKESINSTTKTRTIETGTFEGEHLHSRPAKNPVLFRQVFQAGVLISLEGGVFQASQLVDGYRQKKEANGWHYYIGQCNAQGEYEHDQGILWKNTGEDNRLYVGLSGGQPKTPKNYYHLIIQDHVLVAIQSIFHRSLSNKQLQPKLQYCLRREADGRLQEIHEHPRGAKILPAPDPRRVEAFEMIDRFLEHFKDVVSAFRPTPAQKVPDEELTAKQHELIEESAHAVVCAKQSKVLTKRSQKIARKQQSQADQSVWRQQEAERLAAAQKLLNDNAEQHRLEREKGEQRRQSRVATFFASTVRTISPRRPGEILLPNAYGQALLAFNSKTPLPADRNLLFWYAPDLVLEAVPEDQRSNGGECPSSSSASEMNC